MVKALIALIVLGGIGIGAVYLIGGYGSFDPTEQGNKAKAAITPGMTWNQVVAAAGQPQKYRVFRLEKKRDIEDLVRSGQLDFDLDLFTNDMKAKNFAHGFIFEYVFSQQAAFRVNFDAAGRVEYVEDLKTMADLLDQRGP